MVKNAYQLVFNTGIFAANCREWNKRAAVEKMLPHLKVFFSAAHREWQLSIQNETGAPYAATYNATANPDNGYLQQETVDAIANLVTATASDRADIAQLTVTVARLTTDLAMVNAKLVIALQKDLASRSGRGERNITSRGIGAGAGSRARACPGAGSGTGTRTGAPERTGASAPTMDESKELEPPIHYCWTCGPGCRHNSDKCPSPAAGNIYTDTKRNMQGGEEATK